MNEVKIFCKYDKLVDPSDLLEHPKNRNRHGQDQIERLSKLYSFHGIRHPIIVSNLTGFVVAGHCRRMAAILAGITEFPVVYQDFESTDAEYAFIQSDNAIALWADLDLGAINHDLQDLGPDLNLEMLGLKNFTLDMSEKLDPDSEWAGMPEFDQKDKNSYRHIIVHFNTDEDVQAFAQMIGQNLTDKTKSIWYPEQERMDTEAKRYE